jgi:hypothetical protein
MHCVAECDNSHTRHYCRISSGPSNGLDLIIEYLGFRVGTPLFQALFEIM